MHWLLRYVAYVDDPALRDALRPAHLRHTLAAVDRGELVLGGATGDPPAYALLLLKGEDAGVAEAFACADPYVTGGLVTEWTIERWLTVAGDGAAMPVRAD